MAPLADAANKIATDMMVAAEFHAMPRRWVVGMGPDDFKDSDGRQLSKWSQVAGRVWAAEDTEAKMGQFPEAQLSNFHQTIDTLAALVASIAGLPPHYLGKSSDNPASADAIRSAEARLVKRAERRQRAFGGSWEQVMRLAARIESGTWDESLVRLETIWRDASTPTRAQAADAAVKLHAEGIVPTSQTREDLGYTQEQIARMEAEDRAEVSRMAGLDVSMPQGDDSRDVKNKADAMGVLIRAGVEPEDAAKEVGLKVDFTGAIPTSLRVPQADATKLEG